MRLPVQVVLCVLLSILIQQDRMKGNAKPTSTPLKEDPDFYDPTDESLQLTIADKTSRAVKFEKASKKQLWKVLLMVVDNLSETKKIVSENKQNIEEIQNEFQNKLEKMNNQLVSLKKKLQGEFKGVQGDISNVKGDIANVQSDITSVQGDIVDMQRMTVKLEDRGDMLKDELDDITNANAALCAIGNIGNGNQGLSGPVIVYDTLYQETNGASCSLDISTGKFTAGRSGVYQISVNSPYGKTKDNTYIYVYLRTSSGSYQDDHEAKIAYQSGDGTSYLRTPLNAIRFISLQQGETVWLEYYCNAGLTSTSCGIHKIKFCVSLYK